MINCWIIYPRYVANHNDNAFDWLIEEAAIQDIKLSVLFTEDLSLIYGYNKNTLSHNTNIVDVYPDIVIMRCYETQLSRHFEMRGIPVVNNSESMLLCKDKMLTHQLLANAGISTPLTVYNSSGLYDYSELTNLFRSKDFIVKVIDGAKGDNVFHVHSVGELNDAVANCGGRAICQQFIKHSFGRDVRVWVIGGEAVAAVLRHSSTSFKSNYSTGGNVSEFKLTPESALLAISAANLLGLEFAGVDLLFSDNGFMVCEVNGNAGFRTLSRVGENNIPSELFGYIRSKFTDR